MADEEISVTNNENPPINLEIISYTNEVGVTYVQAKGDKGDKGDTGDKGYKGDKGDVGVNTMLVSSFTGNINGSNTTFVLNENYDDVIIFINGIKYAPSDYTYTKSTATVVFGFAIPNGYALEFYGITNKSANVVPLEDLAIVASSGKASDLINDCSFVTTTQVNTTIQNVVGSAPVELDTLKELADALNDDANFAGTVTTALSNKVDKITGKGLSTVDFTDTSYVHTDNNFTSALKSGYDTAAADAHTHSNKTALDNVSGTNSGDETASTIKTKLGISTLSGSNTGDQDLSGKVDKVTGKGLSTVDFTDTSYVHTDNNFTNALKSSYDTAASDAHTHSNKTALDNVSGNNTGDQDLSGLVTKTTTVNGKALSSNITVGSYSIFSTASAFSPVNATPYYMGNFVNVTPATAAAQRKIYVPKACTITSVSTIIMNGGLGTAETSSVYVRVNNTTDYLVSSAIANNATFTDIQITNLNIPLNAGDYFEVKWVTPTWGTKPTSVIPTFRIGVDL